MAKNGLQQQQQKKTDNGAAAQAAPESIDQVRDLLFGGQMRMVEARIQNLDERLSHETNSMRAEFERQVTELDTATFVKQLKDIAVEGSDVAKKLQAIAEADRSFDPKHFLTGARAAYEMIVTAFAEGDRKSLKQLLSREVFDSFSAATR